MNTPWCWVRFLTRHASRWGRGNGQPPRAIRPAFETLEDRRVPATLTVTNASDTGVSGDGSLRGEILAAQDGDSIAFAQGVNTITLTSGKELLIGHNISIDGAGVVAVSGNRLQSGNGLSRIFEIAAGAQVTISGLIIENGIDSGEGGGILNHGSLTLDDDTIESNGVFPDVTGAAKGGGIFDDGGGLYLSGDVIQGNTAHASLGANAQGGGLYVAAGTVVLGESTVAQNTVAGGHGRDGMHVGHVISPGGPGGAGQGGGMYGAPGTTAVSIGSDTFFENSAQGGTGGLLGGKGGSGAGGAIALAGSATLIDDTVAGNFATGGEGSGARGGNGQGGGIWAKAAGIVLINDTIAGSSSAVASQPTSGNRANAGTSGSSGRGAVGLAGSGVGGGLFEAGGKFMILHNTIVANNFASTSAPDVSGAFTAHDHNLIRTATGSTGFGGSDFTGADPQLATLGANGGPTETMLPVGGLAINHGDNAIAPAADQRGVTRPQGAHVDIGAVEAADLTFTIVSGNSQTAPRGKQFQPLVVELMENGKAVTGVIVDFTVALGRAGAGGKLAHGHVTTDANGRASASVTANATAGSFTVLARAGGLPKLVFTLRNR